MDRSLEIEIETRDRMLEFELFNATTALSSGESHATLSDGTTVVYGGTLMRKALDFPSVVHAVANVSGEVGVGLLTSWLYDKIKGRATKLTINRQAVEITPESIRIVIERIEKEG